MFVKKKNMTRSTNALFHTQIICEKDLPKPYRIIKPGEFTTLDIIENRLNLNVDAKNIVGNAYYG
jgi:hypothetical protein